MGAILALAGMWTEQPWLINVAIGVLGVGILLRLFARRGTSHEEEEDELA